MKSITVDNYRSDKHYQRVGGAVAAILAHSDVISPLDVLLAMGLLDTDSVARWRAGQVQYLERAIRCNLSVASRILRILRLHAHDLHLKPSAIVYRRRARHGRVPLRFTKTGATRFSSTGFIRADRPSGPHPRRSGRADETQIRWAVRGERSGLGVESHL